MFESASIPQAHGFNPTNQISNLRVEKLLMFETGTYYPQFRRPYAASTNAGDLAVIQEKVMEGGQGKITASTFSGAGLKFIAPSAQPESDAIIQSGWNERRFRFLMHVTYNRGSAMGTRFHEVLSGWTDRTDLSLQGHRLDPNLLFTINSVTHLRELVINNGAGLVTNYVVSDNATLLGNPNFTDLSSPTDVSMRPMDIFNHMTLAGADFGSAPVDARTTITNKAIKSKRANNNPNEYLARIVDNMVNATAVTNSRQNLKTQDEQSYGGPLDVVREAKRYSAETSAITDTVLRALQTQAGAMTPQVMFPYMALCGMDPTIDARKFVQYSTPAQPMNLHDPRYSDTHPWHETDGRTHAAVILSLAIPAIMSDCGITSIDFHATNHTIGSQMMITPTKVLSFVGGMDTVMMADVFKQRLIHEVLLDLSEYGQRSLNVIVQADLAGETVINLAFDGLMGEDFVSPSFCDTLMSPVLTGQRGVLTQLTNNLTGLIDSLDGGWSTPSAVTSAVPGNFGAGGYDI